MQINPENDAGGPGPHAAGGFNLARIHAGQYGFHLAGEERDGPEDQRDNGSFYADGGTDQRPCKRDQED